MNKNAAIKAGTIVITTMLTVCSAIECYFDLDGTVEVRDASVPMLRMEDVLGAHSGGNRWEWDNITGFNGAYDAGNVFGLSENESGAGGEDTLPQGDENDTSAENGSGAGNELSGENDESLPQWEPSGEYDPSINLLVLVNKEYPVDENYVPADLVKLNYCAADRSAEWQVMTREAADAFNKMAGDALAEGYEIVATTAYRSYNFQNYLYNSYVEREGQAAADTFSARPGKSEHQTGLAADVTSASVNYRLTSDFGDTEEGKWLAENCYKYGFIMRYQKGKEDITGYIYEPWHVRYVGQKAAKEIWERDLTLEEYLGKMPSWLENSDIDAEKSE